MKVGTVTAVRGAGIYKADLCGIRTEVALLNF
jgi:hypothetical protein